MKATVYCAAVGIVLFSMYSRADFEVFEICVESSDQLEPDIDGDWIVWYDGRSGTSNYDIYGYNLAEPNEFVIWHKRNL